jgi:uncharacterized protein YbjT (DUF2867 family)
MIVITGATGQTGSKTALLLLKNGKQVRVVGRSEENLRKLKEKGAEIAVGDMCDAAFFSKTLIGADAVYLLIPPRMDTPDIRKHYKTFGDAAVKAIKKSGVKKVVFLSSLGAERNSGTGPVVGLHGVEEKLAKLTHVDVAILRAGYFMENLLRNVSLIKGQHINGNSTLPDAPISMVATADIAAKAAELLDALSFSGHSVIDLFGDRISYKEATKQIGEEIGIPDLPYVQFADADAVKAMTGMGLSQNMAQAFVELSGAIGKGLILPTHGDPLKPNAPTSFKEFVKTVFAPAYRNAA